MDWSSDSDEDHDANKEACDPSKEVWISDSDDIPGIDWGTYGTEVASARDVAAGPSKEAYEAGPSHSNWMSHFVAMGFSEELVAKAIKQNREGDMEGILETLLTYGATEKSRESHGYDFPASGKNTDTEDCVLEENVDAKDKIVATLVDMGFYY